MTQITGFGFSNFRVFKKNTFFDFAPLTIFTGSNSSGKSSITRGLSLLSHNANDIGVLNFAGGNHKLGSFNLAKNHQSDQNSIQFQLTFSKDDQIITDILDKYHVFFDYKQVKDKEYGVWVNNKLILEQGVRKENYVNKEILSCSFQNEIYKLEINHNYFFNEVKNLLNDLDEIDRLSGNSDDPVLGNSFLINNSTQTGTVLGRLRNYNFKIVS